MLLAGFFCMSASGKLRDFEGKEEMNGEAGLFDGNDEDDRIC